MIDLSPNIRGLIFDCDGTLADSMSLHMEAWEKAFLDFDEPFLPDFFYPLGGMNEEEIVSLYNERFHRDLDPGSVVDRKHVHFKKEIHLIKPVRPVVDLVDRYRDELPMAVVSGGRRENVVMILDQLGIRARFPVILTADDPIPSKPAPDLFLEAARCMNVAPEHCHVFEDGDFGLTAARKAGMSVTDVRGYL